MIWRKILNWLLERAELSVRVSDTPEGVKLDGHDVPQIVDRYLILTVRLKNVISFTGYWQFT